MIDGKYSSDDRMQVGRLGRTARTRIATATPRRS